jgi:FO synthase
MERVVTSLNRRVEQRNTLYQPVSRERRDASYSAAPLTDMILTPYSAKQAGAASVP